MNFTKKILANVIVLMILFACQPSAVSETSIAPGTTSVPFIGSIPNSMNSIPTSTRWSHYAWFYKPPESNLLALLPEHFDTYILTHKDEQARDQLRQMGITSPFLQYLLLGEIMETESCDDKPYGNQVAYQPGDFCMISEEHPDWFLLDINGNRIKSNDFMYHMDPGSTGYRAFWLERARRMQVEFRWDGIFIDNAEASLSKLHSMGIFPAQYRTDVEYQAAVSGFLSYIRVNFFRPARRPVIANIIGLQSESVWLEYLKVLDGAMIEDFAVGYPVDPPTPEEWENQMDAVEQALQMGKQLVLVAQGHENEQERQVFAYASYLLVNNGNAAFRYTNANDYGQLWVYENYEINLGRPLGSRYQVGDFWYRDFENASVKVNPETFEASIILK